MFCRSCSAEKVTGGGVAGVCLEVCPIAPDDAHKIIIKQLHTTEDFGQKGIRTLQGDMPK